MIQITLEDFKKMCSKAVGEIDKVYCHWTGVGYGKVNFPSYHLVIDKNGELYVPDYDLTIKRSHTWLRNSRAIGISLACCGNDSRDENYLGAEPPTEAQLNMLAQCVAVACINIGIPLDLQHVMTHAEAADNKDGADIYYPDYTGYPNNTHGPDSSVERWDLLVLRNGEERWSGGDQIRGNARFYAHDWGCTYI